MEMELVIEDSTLFKYELAITAILKNEAPYIKEWLDYHLLAGVDHFYLYDNDSTDNLRELLQPYIDNDTVTYKFYTGKGMQLAAYNEAVKDYKFDCQYMAFIDADEFIYPQENKSIKEVLNEILSINGNAEGIVINWQIFGSSNQEKADFSKGVLERFVYKAKSDFEANRQIKSIVNPRCVELIINPHFVRYYEGKFSINENGTPILSFLNDPCSVNKICINHYFTKSKEEYLNKMGRGKADNVFDEYDMQLFESHDQNDVFDDSILSYRKTLLNKEEIQKSHMTKVDQRCFKALFTNLSPFMFNDVPESYFHEKVTIFLTCWAISRRLREDGFSEKSADFFEELSLNCLFKSLISGNVEICQVELLIDEFPIILNCSFPIISNLKVLIKNSIPEILKYKRLNNRWAKCHHLEYLLKMLELQE